MKRFFVGLMTLAATVQSAPAISAPPASAAADDVAFCRDVVLPNVPQATLGECVGYSMTFANSENGFVAFDCDAFMEVDPEGLFLLFDSYSDCVRTLTSV